MQPQLHDPEMVHTHRRKVLCTNSCLFSTYRWVDGEIRVGIFAEQDIKPGEEITFDYQFERFGGKKQQCHCGEDNCRGFLGAKPKKKPPAPRKRVKRFSLLWGVELIALINRRKKYGQCEWRGGCQMQTRTRYFSRPSRHTLQTSIL